jgi:hypothetical protein
MTQTFCQPLNWYTLSSTMADIGAASNVARTSVPAPGFLRRIEISPSAALTGANAVITVTRNGSNLSPSTITVPFSGSADGTYTSQDYYIGVAVGDFLEVSSDGGPTNGSAVPAQINWVLSK